MAKFKFQDILSVHYVKVLHLVNSEKQVKIEADSIIKKYEDKSILSFLNSNPIIIFYDLDFFHIVIIKVHAYEGPNQNINLEKEIELLFQGKEVLLQEETYKGGMLQRKKRSIGTIILKLINNKSDLINLKFESFCVDKKVIFDYAELLVIKKSTKKFQAEVPFYNSDKKDIISNKEQNNNNDLIQLALNICQVFPEKAEQVLKNTNFANDELFKQFVIKNKEKENINVEKSINKVESKLKENIYAELSKEIKSDSYSESKKEYYTKAIIITKNVNFSQSNIDFFMKQKGNNVTQTNAIKNFLESEELFPNGNPIKNAFKSDYFRKLDAFKQLKKIVGY